MGAEAAMPDSVHGCGVGAYPPGEDEEVFVVEGTIEYSPGCCIRVPLSPDFSSHGAAESALTFLREKLEGTWVRDIRGHCHRRL